jgi:hypothetical protein
MGVQHAPPWRPSLEPEPPSPPRAGPWGLLGPSGGRAGPYPSRQVGTRFRRPFSKTLELDDPEYPQEDQDQQYEGDDADDVRGTTHLLPPS